MTGHDGPRSAPAGAASERVVERLDGSTGNAEHILDPGLLQAPDDELCDLDFNQWGRAHRRGDVVFRSGSE
jgi:hypothetical protein